MCKRILTIIAVVLAVSGLALAGNIADITQTGSSNAAKINQNMDKHTASITQTGNENDALIEQICTGSYPGGQATITQTGNKNYGEILDYGGDQSSHKGIITQEGDENYASQLYTSGKSWNGNKGTILQYGNKNKSYQTFGYIGTDYSSQLKAEQHGDENYAEQKSARNGNFGNIYQEGNLNQARQDLGGRTNEACTTQLGDENKAEIVQTGNSNGHDCSACDICMDCEGLCNQYQQGNLNEAYAYVTGDENNTCQCQKGNSNYAYIEILGDLNTAQQCQVNDLNHAEIYQTGNSNVACQCQNGGDSSVITQTGGSNSACVNQGPCACP